MPTTNTIKFKIFKNLILFLVFVSLLTFPLRVARGGVGTVISDIFESAIENTSKVIITLFSQVFSKVIGIARSLFGVVLDFSLAPGLNVKEAAETPWMVLRDFANLIIVFSLLIIAFGFILDIESFDAKKSFFYFIIIALIVNYSMLLTGALYDLSNFLIGFVYQGLNTVSLSTVFDNFAKISVTDFYKDYTYYSFLSELIQDYQTIYKPGPARDVNEWFLVRAYKFFQDQYNLNEETKKKETILTIITNATLNLVMLFIFSSSLIAIFLALSFIFVLRLAYFIFLIGISPLAFAFLILPWTRSYYKTWVSTLITWTVFPVLVLFFVYVALLIGQNLGCVKDICGHRPGVIKTIVSPYVAFHNIFLVVLIFLAISFAKNLSSQAVNIGMTVGKGLTKFLGRTAPSYAARWVGAKTMGRTFKNWGNRAEARFGKDSIITKGIRAITSPVTKEYDRQIGNKKSAIEASYREYLKNSTEENLNRFISHLRNFDRLDEDIRDYIGEIFSKDKGFKNRIEQVRPDLMDGIYRAETARKGRAPEYSGPLQEIYNNNITNDNLAQHREALTASITNYFRKNKDEIPLTSEDINNLISKIERIGGITNRNEVENIIRDVLSTVALEEPHIIRGLTDREWARRLALRISDMNLDPESVHSFLSKIMHGTFGRLLRSNEMVRMNDKGKWYFVPFEEWWWGPQGVPGWGD
jgi:hypothetical protein